MEAPVIPGYQLQHQLATRGDASVWLALSANAAPYAIKCLSPPHHESPLLLSMFRREARVMAQLDHRHICRTHAHGVTPQQVTYTVLDYIGGDTVAALLQKSAAAGVQVPLDVCCEIIGSICDALAYTQETIPRFIHRDLSPQNIMLTQSGEARLIDFGAVFLPTEEPEPPRIWGRPSYTSPEQAIGHRGDLRSDIFSLGVILWEMLTNCRMFLPHPRDPHVVLKQIAAGETQAYPDAADHRPSLPKEWRELLATALAFRADARFQSFGALGEALRGLYDGMSVRVGCVGFLEGVDVGFF